MTESIQPANQSYSDQYSEPGQFMPPTHLEHKNSPANKKLTVLVFFLILAIALQTFYMYRLHQEVRKVNGTSETSAQGNLFNGLISAAHAATTGIHDKWEPFAEMSKIQQQMNLMFDNAFTHSDWSFPENNLNGSIFSPRLALKDEHDRYVIHGDLPGAKESEIKVTLKGRKLTINGKSEQSDKEKMENDKVIFDERQIGDFDRVITLPGPVNAAGMKTSYKNGILTVMIPKEPKKSPGSTQKR